MFYASVLSLLAMSTLHGGHAQTQAKDKQPGTPMRRPNIDFIEVRVVDIPDGDQVLLSFGTEHGARKGMEGMLWTKPGSSMIGIETVELTSVGSSHSIGRFKNGGMLSWMLQRKENPVRRETFQWITSPQQPGQNELQRFLPPLPR